MSSPAGRNRKNQTSQKKDQARSKQIFDGAHMLQRVFPMLGRLARSGTARDKARNRQFLFSHYAALVLIGLFNPVLNSARALVAASKLKKVQSLTGGSRVSLGSFSEASAVFDPHLLTGIIQELLSELQQRQFRDQLATGQAGSIPDDIVQRLVAVDGAILTALPQVVGRLGSTHKGQWRLHAQVRVWDRVCLTSTLTREPSTGVDSERNVLTRSIIDTSKVAQEEVDTGEIAQEEIDLEAVAREIPPRHESHLFLMDRGYRSAALFNTLQAAGHDFICRLNRNDGKPPTAPVLNAAGVEIALPALTDESRQAGVSADELITIGGGSGASPIGSQYPLRRITVTPPDDQSSAARQGRLRSDQTGREELVLATTLLDLPAEQVVLLYTYRWQVELFFRFLKQVLKCNQLLSARTEGVQIQLYCALIVSLLLALTVGQRINKRTFEMLVLFFSGWADAEELEAHIQSLRLKPP